MIKRAIIILLLLLAVFINPLESQAEQVVLKLELKKLEYVEQYYPFTSNVYSKEVSKVDPSGQTVTAHINVRMKGGYISAPDGSLMDHVLSVGFSNYGNVEGVTYSASNASYIGYGIYSYDFTVNFDWPWENSPNPDPDPDDDEENECTCGACCSDKCTCGKWSGVDCCGECPDVCTNTHTNASPCQCHHTDDEDEEIGCTCGACCEHTCTCGRWNTPDSASSKDRCNGFCDHNCTRSHPHSLARHCECHHTEEEEGKCCKHHFKDYVPPELPPFTDPGPPNDPGNIPLPNFGTPSLDTPDWGSPGKPFSSSPGTPAPPSSSGLSGKGFEPMISAESSSGEVEKAPLEYFEREEGKFSLPKFKYAELYDKISDKYKEKFPTDWTSGFSNASSGGSVDLSWTIDTEIFGVKVGPYKFDAGAKLNEFASSNISRILRLIILAYICIVFVMAILGLMFALS